MRKIDIINLEKKIHIASLSGGRDSTAMVELMLSKGMQLDYIVFADTLNEFPQMYEYLEKFDKYIQQKYNKHITYVKPKATFEQWVFGLISRGERKGMIRGLPMVSQPCWWTREAKVYTLRDWLKKEKISPENVVQYIGYTYSETKRAKVQDQAQVHPLIDWKICEADVDRILKEIDMVNPLYEHFERTGCAFCPKTKERGFYVLYKQYPKVWNYMRKIEELLQVMDNVINDRWAIKYTLSEYETIFDRNPKHYSELAPESCECKIEIVNTNLEFNFID